MSLDTLPEKVRRSALALALEGKLSSLQPVAFDYWGEFKRLRETVSAQTGEMKVLFPQFTPHDEEHHLARLFGIADKLLGPQRYEKMNAAELFLLACGLYAHDWGMAVSNQELLYLRSGAIGPANAEVFTPLDDEAQRLRQFAENQGIRSTETEDFPSLSDDQLRLYIRRTHAWRSGVRARAFFKAAGSSVPQALEQVCQGHWLDFSELDDERRFSSHVGVLGHTVNLRAVALYVRLVDLFDISDDRTPYAIWRFVAPNDGVSQMEWKKHRALSPVTLPEYGDGRSVRFDGSTSDPEVWAELEDLRHYCEEQITGTLDLMARHRDERHQLDLRKLEWAVTPERFRPVNVRFEFHRQRMFEILADEIYQGDSHVFLRELLQNSIDAIRVRREMVQRRAASGGRRREVGLGFDDAIYFDVQHGADGDAIVRCRDYGTGMDEYIIRNYLAVAGVSYYQSDEFRHLGLKMDPISRFGIGILSCFMVAERIEIETCREPQMAAELEPLRIDIPAVNRQFRIYPASGGSDVGTTVTVHVRGKKLKGDVRRKRPDAEQGEASKLRVTEYLRAVAGFVEFPIVVDEYGERTVILHPYRSQSDADGFRKDGISHHVRQLSADYPWETIFAPQDVQTAQRHLKLHTFDLRNDLHLAEYEGTLTYVRPVSEEANFQRGHSGASSYEELVLSTDKHNQVTLRQERSFGGYRWMSKKGISPSSQANPVLSVYRDGLFLADADPPNRNPRFQFSTPWPLPVLRVNLPKRLAGKPDVARRSLLGTDASWDQAIWRQVANYLAKHDIAEALECKPQARLSRLAKIAFIFHLTEQEIAALVANWRWPLPILVPEQGATISDDQLPSGPLVRYAPNSLNDEIRRVFGWGWGFEFGDNRFLSNWVGKVSIAMVEHISNNDIAELWMRLSEWHLKNICAPVGIRFLRPPYPGLSPISQQEFHCIEPSKVSELSLMEQTMLDPLSLDANGLRALRQTWWHYELRHIFAAAPFLPPFDPFFIGEDGALNIRHPVTIALLRCAASIRWHQLKGTRHPADIGKAEDRLKSVADSLPSSNLQPLLEELWSLVKQYHFVDFKDQPPPLCEKDYIPLSASSEWMRRALQPKNADEKKEFERLTNRYLRPFGDPLDDLTPEEAPAEVVKIMSKRRS